MKDYKILLFDLDGTLADSDPLIKATMTIMYDKYRNGVRTPDEQMIYFSGPPMRETLTKEFPHMNIDFMFEEFHKTSAQFYSTHVFAYENSREVLLELKSKGYKLGVVTNKVHHLTLYCLECIHLDNIFDVIISIDDVSKPKPCGEGILKAISMLGGTKEETVYIGDNKIDYDSALDAGVDSALVSWGPRKLDPNLKPVFKISSFIDLKEKLYGKSI